METLEEGAWGRAEEDRGDCPATLLGEEEREGRHCYFQDEFE